MILNKNTKLLINSSTITLIKIFRKAYYEFYNKCVYRRKTWYRKTPSWEIYLRRFMYSQSLFLGTDLEKANEVVKRIIHENVYFEVEEENKVANLYYKPHIEIWGNDRVLHTIYFNTINELEEFINNNRELQKINWIEL